MTVKTRIAKYVLSSLNKMLFACAVQVHGMSHYIITYFTFVIQDTVYTFKTVGHAMHILFSTY